jgi:hypothetical protein
VKRPAAAYNRLLTIDGKINGAQRLATRSTMPLQLCRPPVSELVFRLYDRPLHPELFEVLAAQSFQRDQQRLTLRITRPGHVIIFESPGVCLAEVAGARNDPLPDRHQLLHYPLRGEHHASVACAGSVQYQMSFQVETLPPEIFLHIHDEILADGEKRGFLHNFQPNHRLSLAPLGLLTISFRPDSFIIHAFHTFPDEHAVVKSQCLFEWQR